MEGAVIWGVALISVGLLSTFMGFLEVQDLRRERGQFSKRHRVPFGSWKITRSLVALNAWIQMISLIGFGPLFVGLGVWLMLR